MQRTLSVTPDAGLSALVRRPQILTLTLSCRCVVQNDQRHLVLNCVPDERQQILLSYVDELERKGQPPPPTASEPSRRWKTE